MNELFAHVDADGSGFITRQELHAAVSSFNLGMTADDVNDLVTEADRDGDGQISLHEFSKMMGGGH